MEKIILHNINYSTGSKKEKTQISYVQIFEMMFWVGIQN